MSITKSLDTNNFQALGSKILISMAVFGAVLFQYPQLVNAQVNKPLRGSEQIKSNINFSPQTSLSKELNLPKSVLIKSTDISINARRAFETVSNWSENTSRIWYVLYREGNESYIFVSFNKKGYIVRTNPEIGGADKSFPKKTLFTFNRTAIEYLSKNQNQATGAFQFDGGYYEKYVSTLVKIDLNGRLIPNQDLKLPWAIHTPPYYNVSQPATDLTLAGNSCMRVHVDFAKFTQQLFTKEIKNPSGLEFLLRRWDDTLLKQ